MDSNLNLLVPSTKETVYAIDAWIPDQGHMTGVQQYSFQLIQAMMKHALLENERVVLYTYKPLVGALADLPAGWEERVLAWPPRRGWMSLRVGWEILRRPPNVLFVPGQGLPLVCPRSTVTTIHDLAFVRRPDLYHPTVRGRLRRATKSAVKKATKILVPSQTTKNDLIKIYKVPDERIVVTHLAPSSLFPLPSPLTPHPFFLTIGRLEKKKNITTLIRAFELFKSRRGVGDPFELVLVGSPGFGYGEIKKYIELSPFKDQIRELGYVPNDEAQELMRTATAYVFPSWYEGFGIPNLDAMASGTPLITSDIPVHREVVGDAGLFVPPESPEAWARAFEQIARDSTLRDSLIEKGKHRVAEFSWDKTAGETWDVMRGLV
jgi:glycosyltransferase involved in cell wall biosynthesis